MTDSGKRKRLGPFRRFQRDFGEILDGPLVELRLLRILLGVAAGWWVYVPVHELLHALGCRLGGGTVSRLEIDPLYGGGLLAKVFPFVTAGGAYAGRLSGFDTAGSDWTYALTILLPYLLTPLGFLLLTLSLRRDSSLLFGIAAPLLFSPLIGITGDFLELGGLALYQFWPGPEGLHRTLVSDDLFRLLADLFQTAETPEWSASLGWFAAASQILGAALAYAVFSLSSQVQKWGRS